MERRVEHGDGLIEGEGEDDSKGLGLRDLDGRQFHLLGEGTKEEEVQCV